MKYIKLFIASSTVEFKYERQELAAYINSLNSIYVRRGIYFDLIICEDLSNAMGKERKQAEYNAYIQESQYFYVIFGSEAGEYTIEEFDVALRAFKEHGAPKIYTYFLQFPEGQCAKASVLNFMQRIDQELGHFYSTFTHVDSIKLNLLMELCRDPLVGGQVKLEDGQATLDGQAILPMNNIPMYSKNETVKELLNQKRELEEEFSALTALPDSEPVKRMRLSNSEKRNKLSEQLHTLEMDILRLYQQTSQKRKIGAQMNWRETKAIEFVDTGNYEGAKAMLRDEQWKKEVCQAEEIIDVAKDRILEYISGQKTLIQTIKATGVNVETEQEIIAIYEDITGLAEKYQVELNVLYDCASFLYDQNQFSKGIKEAEKLRHYYVVDQEKSVAKYAALLNLLGMLNHRQHVFQKAEEFYRETLDIRRRLARENPAAYEPDVATTCNNLAALLSDIDRYEEAETLYRETLDIRRRLARENPAAYEPDVAGTSNNLAALLSDTGRYEEAETLYREALDICRRLAGETPGAYEPEVAMVCNNLGDLLKDIGHYEEAETLFQESLETYRRLAGENPGAYEPDVVIVCNNLGDLLKDIGHYGEAEALYREALDICCRLAGENPSAYESAVADTSNNLAVLFRYIGRYEEAEAFYREALDIYRRLAGENPGAYESVVADTSNNLAVLFRYIGRYEEAETFFREALDICRRLMGENPGAYEPDVAGTSNNLAALLSNIGRYEEAETLYREALDIRRRLAGETSGAYEPEVAGTLFNLALLFYMKKDKEISRKYFEEALVIYEKYPQLSKKRDEVCEILSEYF